MAKVESKHADGVTAATIKLLKLYQNELFTITADNGKEFAGHEKIAQQLDLKVVLHTLIARGSVVRMKTPTA